MKWPRRLLLAAIALAAFSLWLPWVWHRSAALVLSGLDLPEFVRFMGEVRSGGVRVFPLAFYVPVVVLALALAATAASRRLSVYARLVALAFSLWLLALIFPPLERRVELVLFSAGAVALFLILSLWRPPVAAHLSLLCLAALATGVAPLVQYSLLLPSLTRLYASHITAGVGVYLAGGALLLAVAATGWLLALARRSLGRYAKRA